MWRNTIVIHSILKGKKLQSKIFNQLNIKKVKLTKIILEKKKKKLKKRKKCKKKMKKYEKMNCELLL
jgi:hypothetical protein